MRRKIKKIDCIEYLSVQAPLEKVNMLEDKQSKYIHEFVKRKEYSIVGKIRRNGFSQRDVDRQWNQIVNKEREQMGVLKNKIDFKVFVTVKDANPNGDPLNGNQWSSCCEYGSYIQQCCGCLF